MVIDVLVLLIGLECTATGERTVSLRSPSNDELSFDVARSVLLL